MGNPAYDVVHVQGSAGDRLGPDYNMDEMRIMPNERHSHKTVTPAGPRVYENVDTPRKQTTRKYFTPSVTLTLDNHSLVVASLFHVLSFQYRLSMERVFPLMHAK